jgi:hypothetical protein
MFGSIILDTAIGVALVYLFLSLVDSTVTEFIAGVFGLRAKNLEQGIRSLLSEHDQPEEITKEFFNHPLIKNLSQDGKIKPSYISSRTFALALKDVVFNKASENGSGGAAKSVSDMRAKLGESDGRLSKGLIGNVHILLNAAGEDEGEFQHNIEKWFEESMDRVSGWYRRQTRLIAFGVGMLVAVLLNVDSIHLVQSLYRDSNLRLGLVASAENIAKQAPYNQFAQTINQPPVPSSANNGTGVLSSAAETTVGQINYELEKIQFPIGWTKASGNKDEIQTGKDAYGWFFTLIGWLITAIAVSLGAPFWFDTLSKLIRLAGVKPAESQK